MPDHTQPGAPEHFPMPGELVLLGNAYATQIDALLAALYEKAQAVTATMAPEQRINGPISVTAQAIAYGIQNLIAKVMEVYPERGMMVVDPVIRDIVLRVQMAIEAAMLMEGPER